MEYVVFVLVCLALYCPFFTLIALVTPWKGFAVFSVRHRHRKYRAVHLALLDRVGTMNRRRARRYHQAFIQALEEALSAQPVHPVFFAHTLCGQPRWRLPAGFFLTGLNIAVGLYL